MTPLETARRALLALDSALPLRAAQVIDALEQLGDEAVVELPLVLEVLRGGATPGTFDGVSAWLRLREGSMDPGLRAALVRLVSARVFTLTRVAELQARWRDDPEGRAPLRDEVLATPVPPMGNAHSLYVASARAMPSSVWPRRPVHDGGPAPKLLARGYVEAGLAALTQLRPRLTPPDAAVVDAALPHLERVVASGLRQPVVPMAGHATALEAANALGPELKPRSAPLKVLRSVITEARLVLHSPDKVGTATRAAMKAMAQALADDPAAQRGWLEALDAELVRLDAVAALERLEKVPSGPVRACPWRGVDGAKVTMWVVEVTDERFALLSKPGARWVLTEGDRDTVLATVPDAHFPGVVAALSR
jgi:hypothetical protein